MSDTRPSVASITQDDINSGKTMGILAYIFFIIPLLAARDNKFAMFHTEQAIVLWLITIVLWIVMFIINMVLAQISSTLTCLFSIVSILPWIAYLVLWIMGLMNAIGGKVKELPVIGKFGAKLNLVK